MSSEKKDSSSKPNKLIRNFLSLGFFPQFFGFIGLVIFFASYRPAFVGVDNILTLYRQLSILLIVATGMTVVLLIGNIDLSVGGILTLSGVVACHLLRYLGLAAPLAMLSGFLVGASMGLINGLIAVKGKIPSVITTLGTMSVCYGLSLIILGGFPISVAGYEDYRYLSTGTIMGIPIIGTVALFLLVICFIIIYFTKFGRHIFAIGGSEEVAKLSGVPVDREKIPVFVFNGVYAGIAGVLLTGRMGAATPTAGVGLELDAIASAVLGGTALTGGVGGILRTLIGVAIIVCLNNGLNVIGVNPYVQQVLKGIVLILAVSASYFTAKRSRA